MNHTLAQRILPNLDKVKPRGQDKWIACCPAHDDKSPSMTIKLTDDGRILFHCFAGCTVQEICDSIAVEVHHLFPDDKTRNYTSVGAQRAANRITEDCHYIAVFKSQIKRGYRPTPQEKNLYLQAIAREARA
jgi:hypothetical protein